MIGRVIKCHDGLADVLIEQTEQIEKDENIEIQVGQVLNCCQRGIFRHSKTTVKKILAGDIVRVEIDKNEKDPDKDAGIINEILPRKNFLNRPPIANLDILFIVIAVNAPPPDFLHIDKITAISYFNNIKPVIVINKTDLDNSSEVINTSSITEIYEKSNFTIIKSSTKNNELEKYKFYDMIKNNICAFCGASGVGKTSIMNELFPELTLETADISRKIQRGKHTTKSVDLYAFANGFIADTPGFNILDFERFDYFSKEDILLAFPDLAIFAENCKYSKCSHTKEEDCGVLESIREGKLSLSRHKSYEFLYKQLSLKNSWDKGKK